MARYRPRATGDPDRAGGRGTGVLRRHARHGRGAQTSRDGRRGGAWFRAGPTEVHVGVEADFVPARKAHPALLVADLRDVVAGTGLDVTWSEEIPGTLRCHVDDPFGNRIELIDTEVIDSEVIDTES